MNDAKSKRRFCKGLLFLKRIKLQNSKTGKKTNITPSLKKSILPLFH
jgi:hypothetical protein